MATSAKTVSGSVSVAILEEIWRQLQRIVPEIPDVVVVAADLGGRRRKRGHFAPCVWRARGRRRHELSISPDLFSSASGLLATIVHEAAHAIIYKRGDGGAGVGAGGYYHLKEFRNECRRLGLDCEYLNGRYGWTVTHWPKTGVPQRYTSVLTFIQANRILGTGAIRPRVERGRPTPKSGHLRLVCNCPRERCVYVTPATAKQGGITCSQCNSPFVAQKLGDGLRIKRVLVNLQAAPHPNR